MKNSVGVKVSSFHFLSLFALALIHPFQSHYLNLKRRQNKRALRIMKHLIPTHSHKLSELFAFFSAFSSVGSSAAPGREESLEWMGNGAVFFRLQKSNKIVLRI